MTPPLLAVLGDHFEDRYWIGTTTRISPEAPIPVVKITDELTFPGGAGNVENNLLVLGARIDGVHHSVPAIKNRLVVDNHQLARWDQWDHQTELSVQQIRRLHVDGVVISDYGKGAITYEVVEAIARLNVPTFIDSKRDPRFFDIVMHPYFFPNQKEYLQYVNEYALQPDVIRKKGPEGIAHEQFGKTQWSLPAWATRVVSVCGAGDTVIAAYAYRFFGSVDKLEPLEYANAAAAVVVGKPYTAVASHEEIKAIMTREIRNPAWSAM